VAKANQLTDEQLWQMPRWYQARLIAKYEIDWRLETLAHDEARKRMKAEAEAEARKARTGRKPGRK